MIIAMQVQLLQTGIQSSSPVQLSLIQLHESVGIVVYGFVVSPLSRFLFFFFFFFLTLSQGGVDTFKRFERSPVTLHPTVMWYQVITTPHLHRNSITDTKLPGSIPRTRAKLKIEPLWNSPANGLSASRKPTAVYLNTAHSREEFPSIFHVHRHGQSKNKTKQKNKTKTNTHWQVEETTLKNLNNVQTLWRWNDSIGVTAQGKKKI